MQRSQSADLMRYILCDLCEKLCDLSVNPEGLNEVNCSF